MSILVFVIVVLVVLLLAVWAVQSWFPAIGTPPATPKNLICLLLVAIAILAILHRAGLFPG